MSPPSSNRPSISVLMPVRNEAPFIRQTIESVVNQDYPKDRMEVLVVDGESVDPTIDIVRDVQRGHANVKLFTNPKRLSSAARNIGVDNAAGDYLIIIDGHCQLDDPRYLQKIADAFERSGADCLGRPQPLDVTGATNLQKAIAAARSTWLGHHPASFIYSNQEQFVRPQSVAVAYRRAVFEKIGRFDESFDACEDVEFNHRVEAAGMRCFFTPAIAVPYCPRNSLSGLFRQLARYGRGRVRLLRKHSNSWSAASLVPAAFLLGLMAGPIASYFSVHLAWIFAATLCTYLFFVLGVSATIAARARNAPLLLWLPCVFVTIHIACGWGTLYESCHGLLRKKKTANAVDLQPISTK